MIFALSKMGMKQWWSPGSIANDFHRSMRPRRDVITRNARMYSDALRYACRCRYGRGKPCDASIRM